MAKCKPAPKKKPAPKAKAPKAKAKAPKTQLPKMPPMPPEKSTNIGGSMVPGLGGGVGSF